MEVVPDRWVDPKLIEALIYADEDYIPVIAPIGVAEARAAIRDGVATGGMIPKLETCIAAVEAGVGAVVILDGRRPHALLVELFTEHGAGTLVCE